MPAWLNRTAGIAARNGTATHTITFSTDGDAPFTPTDGRLLVLVVSGPVTHSWPGGWTEQLQPVNNSELSVATITASSTTSVTVTHNASDYPIHVVAFEFAAGTTWVNGASASNQAYNVAQPTVGSLPGTPVTVIYGVTGARAAAAATPSATWSVTETYDADAPKSGTDGSWLSVAYEDGVTASSATTTPTITNFAELVGTTTERVSFALDVPSGGTSASAGNASGTGAAYDATPKVTPAAGNAAGTGAAHDATVATAVVGPAENAAGTGTANAATAAVTATAGNAAGTGTAYDATISTAAATTASAGNAAGTGTANNAAPAVAPAPATVEGTGTANNAAAGVAPPAGHASGTGAANSAGPGVAPVPTTATGTGAANDATVATSGGTTTATAGNATGTGTAYDATVSTTSTPVPGSWGPLLALVRESRTYRPAPRPVACPNDGEPLELVRGRLHCPYDGWEG